MIVDRTALIGRPLRAVTYTVSEVDVNDFLGVVAEPDFEPADDSETALRKPEALGAAILRAVRRSIGLVENLRLAGRFFV
jgi:hypothetical protein